MPEQIPIVSLFCGCGGMDSGLKQQGFIPIIAIDNSEIAIKTYNENNMPHVAVKSDISKLSGEKIISMIDGLGNGIKPHGIVGGPPCQSFSISNVYHNPEDPRNFLSLKFASIIKDVNKKYKLDFFIFENVVGLNSKKHANVFESIKKAFIDAGFNLFVGELNAKYFGVAQSRKRLFVVGINKDLYPNIEFKFPKGNKGCIHTVRDVIGNLPEPILFSRSLSAGDIPFHQNHWTMNPKSPKFSNNLAAENSANGRSFRKLDWDKPSDTLAFGHREINVHPNGHRRISIFEAMRIQGFPDSYKIVGNLTQQVYQVSDALPPNVASAIGEYKHALRINPEFAEAYYNLGIAYKNLGKLDEAIVEYQKALRINPNFVEARYNLGVVYKQKGRHQEAIECFQAFINIASPKHAPNVRQAKNNIHQLKERQK